MRQSVGEHTFESQHKLARTAVAAAVLVLVLVAAGCGSSNAALPRTTTAKTTTTAPTTTTTPLPPTTHTGAANEFSDFKIAMDQSTDYLDPGLSDTAEAWGVMWNVYLPLLGYEHVNGKAGATLVPYLAAGLPHVSENGRVYRLRLRKNLHYSDGSRVVASDFRSAVERSILLDSAGAAFFSNIAGAAQFASGDAKTIGGIRAHDKQRTIEIHLLAPEGDFANILASEFAAPVPSSAPPTDSSLHPLPATGPYEIVSYQPHSRIVEVRNPYFNADLFDGNVPAGNPDRVTWDIVPSARAALHAVLTGKDDWMSYWSIPEKRLAKLETLYLNTRLQKYTLPNLSYFFMNTRVAPFNNVMVRRAVNYAISRKWLVHLAGGLAVSTENVLPPGYPSYVKHRLYPYDIKKARKLVEQSGMKGKRVTVWNHDVAGDLPFTQYLVRVLNKLGFKAHEHDVTPSNYWSTLSDPHTKAQIGFANWIQDYPHPLDWFGVLLDGRQTHTARNDNYAYFNVPAVNQEIDSLTRQPASDDAAWAQLDRTVMEQAPWAPFLEREAVDFFSARVSPECYVNNVLYGFDYASICVKK
jgi:peptide/nickel transport system substrate-binding protein